MGTLNSNEQLFGLKAVKANAEALAAHEERARFAMVSRCPLKNGDIITILPKADDLVGSYLGSNGRWNEALRIKVNGEDQNIAVSVFVKERADINEQVVTANGDLNSFMRDNKSLLPEPFREKLAAEMAGEYIVSTTTHITTKLRYTDSKKYASAETFYSANKKA